jgi:hypothetical protein
MQSSSSAPSFSSISTTLPASCRRRGLRSSSPTHRRTASVTFCIVHPVHQVHRASFLVYLPLLKSSPSLSRRLLQSMVLDLTREPGIVNIACLSWQNIDQGMHISEFLHWLSHFAGLDTFVLVIECQSKNICTLENPSWRLLSIHLQVEIPRFASNFPPGTLLSSLW